MNKTKYILIFILLELFLAGMGMGVPILLILFGFFVGFFLAKKNMSKKNSLKKIFNYSLMTSGFSLLIMLIVWGIFTLGIIRGNFNIFNSGIPMILYEPLASFIGWMILMIFISPFLQFLMTILGAYTYLMTHKK